MTFSHLLAPELPYLRRFARALTGQQRLGDACTAATLEAILAKPQLFDRTLAPRVALYKVFLAVWLSGARPAGNGPDFPRGKSPCREEHSAANRLDALAPRSRIAFLLAAVEDFAPHDIAETLGCPESEVRALLAEARREIGEQIATDVLILEDEPVIAMDLEDLVGELGHRVVGVARTKREALAFAEMQAPGLILADLQLADGSSGLSAANELLQTLDLPVIFVTAYPEQLLTGGGSEPAFLIAKPFRSETVKAAISQALFFGHKSQPLPDRSLPV